MKEPKSLQQAILYFSNPDNCLNYLAVRRWPNGVVCPTCGSEKVSFSASRRIWQCSSHHAKRQFSVKVGTIFEDSPIGLDKWLAATWMLTNCKNGISSYEIGRALNVTQKSAWFMMHRIRLALQDESFGTGRRRSRSGRNFYRRRVPIHARRKRKRMIGARGPESKVPVLGILQRGGKVRATVIPRRTKKILQAEIRKHVKENSFLATDALMSYNGLNGRYAHEVIDHAHGYVRGKVHTNGLENFWSLLKRGLKGTYVSVEPFHLFRYLDEQMFRYNNREQKNDGDRFSRVVKQIVGKRLTWNQLTGKVPDLRATAN